MIIHINTGLKSKEDLSVAYDFYRQIAHDFAVQLTVNNVQLSDKEKQLPDKKLQVSIIGQQL